jgi:hypothetical protein
MKGSGFLGDDLWHSGILLFHFGVSQDNTTFFFLREWLGFTFCGGFKTHAAAQLRVATPRQARFLLQILERRPSVPIGIVDGGLWIGDVESVGILMFAENCESAEGKIGGAEGKTGGTAKRIRSAAFDFVPDAKEIGIAA